jgi:hypothetical protein
MNDDARNHEREDVIVSRRFEISKIELDILDISAPAYKYSTLPRNIGIQLRTG